jgi:HSP20 family protein
MRSTKEIQTMATLVRWDPFREMAQFQNELGRLFGGVANGQTTGAGSSWVPALDAWETEDEIVYAFDLPGVAKDKLAIELEDGALTVTAERERDETADKDGFYRFERRHGSFARTIGLPQGVDESSVRADYRDGVLEVRVQKPKAPEPRRIQIGGDEQSATIEGSAQQVGETSTEA